MLETKKVKSTERIEPYKLSSEIYDSLEKIKKFIMFRGTLLQNLSGNFVYVLCKKDHVIAKFSKRKLTIAMFQEDQIFCVHAKTENSKVLFYQTIYREGSLYERFHLSPDEFFGLCDQAIAYKYVNNPQ